MSTLAALRSTVAELEREYRALGGDDGSSGVDGGGEGGGLVPHVGRVSEEHLRGSLVRTGGGNPNHDAEGKFASGPGAGHGKHHARRQRRKKRLKRKLQQLKVTHKADRRALAARQRERHAKHRERFDRKRASLDKRQSHDLKRMDAEHAREIGGMERRRERERAHESAQKAKGKVTDAQVAKWEADHARDVESTKDSNVKIRKELEGMHEFDRATLRQERKDWATDIKAEHARQRKGMLRRQRDERTEAIEEHGFKRREKGAQRGLDLHRGHSGGRDLAVDRGAVAEPPRRIGPGRTHKASSAEAILRHCLRRLGLSAAYRRGDLTGEQAIEVLSFVREYCRAWLRHEVEALIRHYGRAIDGMSLGTQLDGRSAVPDFVGNDAGLAPGGIGESRALGTAIRHHVGRFFDRVKGFIRESILAGAMALSGPEGLTPDDLAEADRQHAVQVAYLDQFHRDVEARGPAELSEPSPLVPAADAMTAAEMAARAEMYGSASWGAAHEINRRGVIKDGKAVRERRFHWREVDHPCGTCAAESAKGWVPVGTLLKIGDSECLGIGCDCYFSYMLEDGSYFITRRGWRKAA